MGWLQQQLVRLSNLNLAVQVLLTDVFLHDQDIKPYESIFGQDIDGDGSIGLDLTTLVEAGNDSVGDYQKRRCW